MIITNSSQHTHKIKNWKRKIKEWGTKNRGEHINKNKRVIDDFGRVWRGG